MDLVTFSLYCSSAKASLFLSVIITPGARLLIVIPYGASWVARERIIKVCAAFEAGKQACPDVVFFLVHYPQINMRPQPVFAYEQLLLY